MSDASAKMHALFVDILAHLPASVQTEQKRCSLRRYSLAIPRGRSANFRIATRGGVTMCGLLSRYLPDGFASRVVNGGGVGYS